MVRPRDHQYDSLVSFTRFRTSVRFVEGIINNSQIQSVSFLLFRDIKPHNFVLTPVAHDLLIDFGSAAPLLPPNVVGSQSISKQYCLIPCGICDFISPGILRVLAHENALLALEMNDEDDNQIPLASLKDGAEGYGVETDWSLGEMLYEMAYGVAPFFANDIRQTYIRIMVFLLLLDFYVID
jgi:serine/threonine protein kinase